MVAQGLEPACGHTVRLRGYQLQFCRSLRWRCAVLTKTEVDSRVSGCQPSLRDQLLEMPAHFFGLT